MPTSIVSLDETQYVQINVIGGLLLQSLRDEVRIAVNDTQPAKDTTAHHTLSGADSPLPLNPDTNVWALAMTNRSALIVSPHVNHDPRMDYAIDYIKNNYGDVVSIESKSKKLTKFGRSDVIGTTKATIMTLPAGELHETYVNDNLIDTVSSDNTGDTRTLVVEGHTLSGGNLTFSTETITLNGQNKVTLSTPLARVNRMYAPDGDTTDLVGVIYAYEDTAITAGVPTDGTKVHCMIPAGENQTFKTATAISSEDYWIINRFDADCFEKTSAFAEVRMEVKHLTGVWRPVESIAVSSGGNSSYEFDPFYIVPPNTDVRLIADADGAGTSVGGMIQGVLAKVIG